MCVIGSIYKKYDIRSIEFKKENNLVIAQIFFKNTGLKQINNFSLEETELDKDINKVFKEFKDVL